MAVQKRLKETDETYSVAIGVRPPLTNREPELEDVISDLREDVNNLTDLANLIDGFTFAYEAIGGGSLPKLRITHVASNSSFTINKDK
tara:strand:+ start:994 stop:1257 length:264 start_codon:yes stop_codon:yes gene_type:complete